MTLRIALMVSLLATSAGCAGWNYTPLKHQPKRVERALSTGEVAAELARLAPTLVVLHAHSGTIIAGPAMLTLTDDHLLAHLSYAGGTSSPCDYMLALPLSPTAYEASENETHTSVKLVVKPNNYRVLEDCASDAFDNTDIVLNFPTQQGLRALDLLAETGGTPAGQRQQHTTR